MRTPCRFMLPHMMQSPAGPKLARKGTTQRPAATMPDQTGHSAGQVFWWGSLAYQQADLAVQSRAEMQRAVVLLWCLQQASLASLCTQAGHNAVHRHACSWHPGLTMQPSPPVLLWCLALTTWASASLPSHTRSVSSRLVLTTFMLPEHEPSEHCTGFSIEA